MQIRGLQGIKNPVIGRRKDGRPIYAIVGGAPTLEEVRERNPHRQKAARLASEARQIAEKAEEEGRDLTDEETAEVRAKAAERRDLLRKADELEEATKELVELARTDGTPKAGSEPDDSGERSFKGQIGWAFVKSPGFIKNRDRAKDESYRARGHVGSGEEVLFGQKAIIGVDSTATTFPTGQQFPTVDLTGPEDTGLLNLISRGSMTEASLRYLQITGVTEGADIVAPGALKPLSDLATQLATAEAYTYADGFAVANQALADEPFLASYLQARLPRHLRNKIQDILLNGTGTDEPAGILNTTGVQDIPFTDNLLDSIADGFEAVEDVDGVVQAVAVSPDVYWSLMKLRDDMGRYYSQGPWSQGPGMVWGVPLVKVRRFAPGTVVLGEWSTVFLLDREGVSVVAFNQHADFAQRNQTYVRGEYRGAQMIIEPNKLATVATVAAP